jgi:dienelactone hydrolase
MLNLSLLRRPSSLLSLGLAFGAFSTLLSAAPAAAAVQVQKVVYPDDKGTALEGLVAFDDAVKGKRPGVVVVHDWMGVSETTTRRLKELAALGYVAFAADIYGRGVRPKNAQEASAQSGIYKADRGLMQRRAQAALDTLSKDPRVDASNLAAIGFCFGGTVAIELGKSGAPLKGVVSFHGGLDAATPATQMKSKLLVLHGADDPFVKATDIAAFKTDLNAHNIDWTLVEYAGTVHSFTDEGAGSDVKKGAAYNARSAARAKAAMKTFFDEVFTAPKG